MLIFGHKWIASPIFIEISTIEEVKDTPPNSVVILDMPTDDTIGILIHCSKNNIKFALKIDKTKDMILASNLGASYAITSEPISIEKFQKIANEYLYDMKLLLVVPTLDNVDSYSQIGLDGVLLAQ